MFCGTVCDRRRDTWRAAKCAPRRAGRQEQAKLLLDAMHDWLYESLGNLSAKSETTIQNPIRLQDDFTGAYGESLGYC